MPRKAIIRPAIIRILEDSSRPLRFSELKTEVKKRLNRNHLDDKQLYYNLQKLLNQRAAEKIIFEGRPAYRLTSSYYEEDLTRTLVEILNKRRPSEVYADLIDSKSASHIVYVVPPAYDYETKKRIDGNSVREEFGVYGGGPMTRIGEFRYIPKWEHPYSAMSSVMLNDFNGLLNTSERRGISELLRWAYWAGCKISIEEDTVYPYPLPVTIERNRKFALKCIEKFKENPTRVAVEQTLLDILSLTEKLIGQDNLADFFSFLYGNNDEYKFLLKKLTSLAQERIGGGEKIFHDFTDFHFKVILGLTRARLIENVRARTHEEQIFLMYGNVWSDFLRSIILTEEILRPSDFRKREDLRDVSGSLEEAVTNVTRLKNYLEPLLEIPSKRKIAIIYLWGFPQVLALSEKEFILEFESWVKAVEKGALDYEPWIFDHARQAIIRTLRAIKRGKTPPPLLLYMRRWTTRDIWEHHPHGKDPEFWSSILKLINARADKLQRYARS